MKRREFMSAVAASAGFVATGQAWGIPVPSGPLPKRALGKTGLDLSVIGFGGIVARDNTPAGVEQAVAESIDLGINFFDTAASYGNSEVMLAPVLKSRRSQIVLATKTRERTREGAQQEFERSCEILGTDHFDMFLVHGIQHVENDVEAAFAPDGAMEYLLERKKAGQIHQLGFSSHSTESALRAMELHDFDFFYFPISYVSWYEGDFGPAVLEKAREKSIPCVALKALARAHWPDSIPREDRCAKCWYQPIDQPEEASLALRWALSQGVVSILPPGNEQLYQMTLGLRDDLTPITEAEMELLKTMAKGQRPLFPR